MMLLNTNKKLPIYLSLLFASYFFTACDNSTGSDSESEIETYIVTDLAANPSDVPGRPPTAIDFTFYSLRTNSEVSDADSASANWDIAFSGTTIIVNSGNSGPGQAGAVVLDVPFNNVSVAPSEGYQTDTENGYAIDGWYIYTGMETVPHHAVIPIDNKTLVVRTADGKHYAKIKIISYYKGNPDVTSETFADTDARAPGRYYTFEYAIQKNGSREFE